MFTNHLIQEKSPYLLQHAHNPVDWYPWCKEAFEKAAEEKKPVFLSIGYSTCHWCHVMEQESFEDTQVAEILNDNYISIKVDREERPDVDSIYMEVCQMLTGSGGWPLTILMTPQQEPFYAGTYLPRENRYGRMGLLNLLTEVSRQWNRQPGQLLLLAGEITDNLRHRDQQKPEKHTQVREQELLKRGADWLMQMFDKENGGFSGAPKFPMPHNLLFLMSMAEAEEEGHTAKGAETSRGEEWMQAVEQTLQQMFQGGIFDHIGGGFSRYSTDDIWLVPHFEKMLYDNALLSLAYLEGYRITQKSLYRLAAERTLAYIMEELTHEKGGFFCGQDADSEGEEGKYYVFTPEEIVSVLGEQEGLQFCQWYDITEQGNFEGKSIPNLRKEAEYEKVSEAAKQMADKLLEYRKGRMRLHKDDKVLTGWNGLAIWAFARAYQITGVTAYYKQAKEAASFIRANLMTLNGRLKVRWRENHVAYEGNLSDYACYAVSLLELYQCDFDISWLRTCMGLTEKMLELFEDKERGGFFFSGTKGEVLISKSKETYDGAIPSGNSMAGLLLVRLAKLTGENFWQEAAQRQITFLTEELQGYEVGHTMALLALKEWQETGIHLVCVSEEEIPEEEIRSYRKKQKEYVASMVITKKNQSSLARMVPQAADYPIKQGEILYYICCGESCQPPVSELDESFL